MAAEKDRHSRMLHSTVNAPLKKGGAGAYTWGTPLDVTDYEPKGIGEGHGVITAPSPTIVHHVAAPVQPYVMDPQAFPTLGGYAPTVAPTVMPVTSWGPQTAPAVVSHVSEASLRTGALDIVDAQHPRHQFARKPQIHPTKVVSTHVQQGMIDWSQAGIPATVMTAIAQSNQYAHLGPYGQPAPSTVPLETLRIQNQAAQTQFQQYVPTVTKQVIAHQKPTIVHQPMRR